MSVLLFHRVQAKPDEIFPGEVDAQQFDEILGWVKNWCNVLPLDEAVNRLKTGSLPARAAAITFDDGYADNHDVALPILQRHGLKATFFVATGFLNGGRMWNDTVIEAIRHAPQNNLDLRTLDGFQNSGATQWRLDSPIQRRNAIAAIIGHIKYEHPQRREALANAVAYCSRAALPLNLMMRDEQVRSLHRAGMQIGAHTHTHPILAMLDAQTTHDEILRSKVELESLIDQPVSLFAYPNGRPKLDYTAENTTVVRRLGFAAAVSTATGAADGNSDFLQIPRFTPWDRTRTRFGLRLAANLVAKRQSIQ